MLKLLIADDEYNIRNGISRSIRWADYGIEVCGTAANGNEAFELAKLYEPELLIMDINMPYMNGLDLTEKARAFLPDSAFLILTGYDAFEYAKRSVHIGVSDYLLKPVAPGDLLAAVLRAKDAVLLKQAHKEFIKGLESRLAQAMPLLRERFVYDALHGNPQEDGPERLQYLGLEFRSNKFAALHIELANFPACLAGRSERDKQLAAIGVKSIADDLLAADGGLAILAEEGAADAVACIPESGDMPGRLASLKDEICARIGRELGLTAFCSAGGIYCELGQLPFSYREAITSFPYDGAALPGGIAGCDRNAQADFFTTYPFEKEAALLAAVQKGDDRAKALLGEIFSAPELRQGEDAPALLRLTAVRLSHALLRLLERMQLDTQGLRENHAPLLDASPREGPEAPGALEDGLRRLLEEALRLAGEKLPPSYQSATQKAARYIEENYAGDLSLRAIAGSVYMNSNYLCTLFKNERGETINSFIIRVRMEKAMELLKKTDKKVFEISEAVGYKNTNYFGAAFKKYTGLTPNEYKAAGAAGVTP